MSKKFIISNGSFLKNGMNFCVKNSIIPFENYTLTLNVTYPSGDPSQFTYIQSNSSEIQGERDILWSSESGDVSGAIIDIDSSKLTDNKFYIAMSKSSFITSTEMSGGISWADNYPQFQGSIYAFKITGDGSITMDISEWDF